MCRSVCRSWGWSASRQLGERSSLDFRGHDDFVGASCISPHANEQDETEYHSQAKSSVNAISPLSLAAFKSLR